MNRVPPTSTAQRSDATTRRWDTGRRLRIAMVGPKGVPAMHGGIERHVDEISQRLVRAGHHVDVFTRHYHPVDTPFHQGVRLRRRWTLHTKHLDAASHTAWCVLEAVLSHRYDLLHVHGIGPGLFVPSRALGLPSVFTYHAQDWRQRKWGRLARWSLLRGEQHAVRTAAEIITVSRLLQQYVRERYARAAHYIPNGADLPDPPGVDRLDALALSAGSYVLFVGRLIADRGVDTLVEAFHDIPGDLRLAIVGESHLSPDEMRSLRAAADDRVLFLGQQTGEVLQQIYAHAAFCVHPSRVEGMPIAVLEAMSHGRAVLVSDIPENIEAIGDAGLTFPVGDADRLGQQMRLLQEDPQRCAALGAQARQRVEQCFDWESIAIRTEAVYRSALATA